LERSDVDVARVEIRDDQSICSATIWRISSRVNPDASSWRGLVIFLGSMFGILGSIDRGLTAVCFISILFCILESNRCAASPAACHFENTSNTSKGEACCVNVSIQTLSCAVKILRSIGACRNGRTNLVDQHHMGERKLYFKGSGASVFCLDGISSREHRLSVRTLSRSRAIRQGVDSLATFQLYRMAYRLSSSGCSWVQQ
jgi:hypothetical protein